MSPTDYIKVVKSNQESIDALVDKKKYIYRYLPLKRMLEIVQRRNLSFINPIKWNDPFDKFLFKQAPAKNSSDLLSSLYCLCFTLNPHSEAYWKAYATEGYVARLRINTQNFISFLYNIGDPVWLIKMKYLYESLLIEKLQSLKGLKSAISERSPNEIFLRAFHYKRMPFKYEEEIRVLLNSKSNKSGIKSYNISLNEIVSEIRLDPHMSGFEEKAWKEYLSQFGIPVTKSRLFSEKKIKIL